MAREGVEGICSVIMHRVWKLEYLHLEVNSYTIWNLGQEEVWIGKLCGVTGDGVNTQGVHVVAIFWDWKDWEHVNKRGVVITAHYPIRSSLQHSMEVPQ